jgi:cytochrome P450
MHLARLQTTVAVHQILARLAHLELVDAEPPSGFAFRRPPSLHIRWGGTG